MNKLSLPIATCSLSLPQQKQDPKEFEVLKRKEIANGRLAMVAFLGILMQSAANGMGPVEAWAAHVADPWHVSAAQNVAAVPFA